MPRRFLALIGFFALVATVFLLSTVPAFATDIVVTSTADSGPGTLRQALMTAASGDTIYFHAAFFPAEGSKVIYIRSQLPSLGTGVYVNGVSPWVEHGVPPAAASGVNTGEGSARIILDGSLAGPAVDGLGISGVSTSITGLTVRKFGGNGIIIRKGAGASIGRTTLTGNGGSGLMVRDGALNLYFTDSVVNLNGADGVTVNGPTTGSVDLYTNIIGMTADGASAAGNQHYGVFLINAQAVGVRSNLISGNKYSGVRIEGPSATGNVLENNVLGLSKAPALAVPNERYGVELANGATGNDIGRRDSEYNYYHGNEIGGNTVGGVAIRSGAHHNRVAGNYIGSNWRGETFPGQHWAGGVLLADGAHDNQIGCEVVTENCQNWIGANGTAGVVVRGGMGESTDNIVDKNHIGQALSGGEVPIAAGNQGHGVLLDTGAKRTRVNLNEIAFNVKAGVNVLACSAGQIMTNVIHHNEGVGIAQPSACIPQPLIRSFRNPGANPIIRGTAAPGSRVQVFGDWLDEGYTMLAATNAGPDGWFEVTAANANLRNNLTVTATDGNFNTSRFSMPVNQKWTVMLYLNGDNDLSQDLVDSLVDIARQKSSMLANVFALVDRRATDPNPGTVLYRLSGGTLVNVGDWTEAESNMGDGQTLVNFATWVENRFPTTYHALAIVDHGGGWAPSPPSVIARGALPHHRTHLAGGSGLSWDETSGDDYLSSTEIRSALDADHAELGAQAERAVLRRVPDGDGRGGVPGQGVHGLFCGIAEPGMGAYRRSRALPAGALQHQRGHRTGGLRHESR